MVLDAICDQTFHFLDILTGGYVFECRLHMSGCETVEGTGRWSEGVGCGVGLACVSNGVSLKSQYQSVWGVVEYAELF